MAVQKVHEIKEKKESSGEQGRRLLFQSGKLHSYKNAPWEIYLRKIGISRRLAGHSPVLQGAFPCRI